MKNHLRSASEWLVPVRGLYHLLTSTTAFSLGLTADRQTHRQMDRQTERQTDRQKDNTCKNSLIHSAQRINSQIAFDFLAGRVLPLLLGAYKIGKRERLTKWQAGIQTQTGC